MPIRTLMAITLALSIFVVFPSQVAAALPPEVRKELSDLSKELRDVGGMIKKKEVDEAKALIQKIELRVKELAIADDEKDRSYSSFRGQLEKAKNLMPVSFEHEVAPILKANCLRCHGENDPRANLRLDTFSMIAQGGRNGGPVVPRLPARSGLLLRLVAENEQQRMPKGQARLPDEEIRTIARWIEQGANFDGTDRDAPIGDSTVEKKPPVKVVMADGSESVSFRKDIAPWMVNICIGCHSGNNPRGDFAFTTFEQLLQGGPTGSTIVPHDPDSSYIVDLVLRQEPLKMPQGQAQLKRSQATALETWIREGARFDGDDAKAPLRSLVPTAAELAAAKLTSMTDEEMAAHRAEQAVSLWKQVSPKTEAVTFQTDNFLLYGSVSEDRLKEIGSNAKAHLSELMRRYPLPNGEEAFRGRLILYVTNHRFDYEEFNTVLLDRRTPDAVSGHSTMTPNFELTYVAMHDVGSVESPDALTATQLLNALISESYLTRDGSSLPDWLKQGFGIHESGLTPSSEFLKAIPRRAATAVSTVDDAGRIFDDGTFAPEEVGAVGYLLVKFLKGIGGEPRFQQLIGELRTNPDGARAVRQTYNTPPDQLGQAFLRSGGN